MRRALRGGTAALAEWLARRERERFIGSMVAEMREGDGDEVRRREALALSEELLTVDADAPNAGEAAGEEPAAGKRWR